MEWIERSAHVGSDDGYAVVEVRDDGTGIPRRNVSGSLSRTPEPTTVPGWLRRSASGLTVSRQLAELMNGSVVYSREHGLSILRL